LTILPRVISIIRIPNNTRLNVYLEVGSLVKVDWPNAIRSLEREQITLASDFTLTDNRTLDMNWGGVF
jgi:hypothetical protein